ncbi:MTA/SAH nucleosidase [Skermanella stibiiresistens SB22]|uniref:adenosylhomocysteine nucleosidase n=1 Tax=Skermanella stibiiresistens SB22 TaxID=1385369 RepID=W9H7K7_9PROT|nr:5'-methylthioadenosine/adenosylhomocysteine nucleosidase [Skermanella stibiiresistens]EWY42039.1 MTA/SAH nucleosidase [Skermanella stibiiresistens SB22]
MTVKPLGLICAIPDEIAHFGSSFTETATRTLAGLTFREGTLEGRPTVMVESGIGKVNAAVVSTLLAEIFDCHALLFSGVAGGLDPALGIGDVVIATRLVQHDYGALVEGRIRTYQPGIPPLPGFDDTHGYALAPELEAKVRATLNGIALPAFDAKATGAAPRVPALHFGTILTGDTFLNCEETRERLHRDFGQALAIEMEGAAVAQVAERYGIPCLVVRSLSDLAGADSHMDFASFCGAAAEGAAVLIRRLVAVV